MNDCVVVTVGHVDHGKSSVIGRLMADAGVLPKGKLEAVRDFCARGARPFEYAYLLDALKLEQAQGITLDVARTFFTYQNKTFEILDAPGHVELLKNMVTGASRADAALLVVDASAGVEENTRRHAYYLQLLGVRQVVVAVNKMDLVAYSTAVFDKVVADLGAYLATVGIEPVAYVPLSAAEGDNVVFASSKTPWYEGEPLLAIMMRLSPLPPRADLALRLPLQDVYRFGEMGDNRRILAGTIVTGTLAVGNEICFYPSGKRTVVRSIESLDGTRPDAQAGQAVGFCTADELVVMRGEMVVRADQCAPTLAVKVRANVFWLGDAPFAEGKSYTLKIGTAATKATVQSIEKVLNAAELAATERHEAGMNEIATAVLSLDAPIAFDVEAEYETNRFALVDGYDIVAGGQIVAKIEDAAYDGKNLKRTYGNNRRYLRRAGNVGRGAVIWLSGLSGSGKTTLASGAAAALVEMGVNAYILDGDVLRSGINADLDFSPEGRRQNVLRTGHIAKLMADAGVVVIVTLISPYERDRAEVRRLIGDNFWGVYVKASPEACYLRDPKQLYAKAKSGQMHEFLEHCNLYEPYTSADLVIDTEAMSEVAAADLLRDFIFGKIHN